MSLILRNTVLIISTTDLMLILGGLLLKRSLLMHHKFLLVATHLAHVKRALLLTSYNLVGHRTSVCGVIIMRWTKF